MEVSRRGCSPVFSHCFLRVKWRVGGRINRVTRSDAARWKIRECCTMEARACEESLFLLTTDAIVYGSYPRRHHPSYIS